MQNRKASGFAPLGDGFWSLGIGCRPLGMAWQPLEIVCRPLGRRFLALGTGWQRLGIDWRRWARAFVRWKLSVSHWESADRHWDGAVGHWEPAGSDQAKRGGHWKWFEAGRLRAALEATRRGYFESNRHWVLKSGGRDWPVSEARMSSTGMGPSCRMASWNCCSLILPVPTISPCSARSWRPPSM